MEQEQLWSTSHPQVIQEQQGTVAEVDGGEKEGEARGHAAEHGG